MLANPLKLWRGVTRLELATSGVTGRRSNQTELHPRKSKSIPSKKDIPFRWSGKAAFQLKSCNDFILVGGTGLEPVTLGL